MTRDVRPARRVAPFAAVLRTTEPTPRRDVSGQLRPPVTAHPQRRGRLKVRDTAAQPAPVHWVETSGRARP